MLNSQKPSYIYLVEATPISQIEASVPTAPTESNVWHSTNQFPPNYDDIENYLTIIRSPVNITDNDY